MVWHEVGRYGVHNGRTLRSPWKPWRSLPSIKAGYIQKVVINWTNPLEKQQIERHLNNFRVADGFDKDSVVTESEIRSFELDDVWGWPLGGFRSGEMVLSLNKKKRWLLPTLLREKLAEEKETSEGEGVLDPRVVLIERKSANNDDHESSILRLRKGDCVGVLDSNDLTNSIERKRKIRKLCHVGDKYKHSKETEIIYEVCNAMSTHSWPNYKETSSNPARLNFWNWNGDFRKRSSRSNKKRAMMKYSSACVVDMDLDYTDDMDLDYADYVDDDDIPMTQGDSDYRPNEFDLEACIANAVCTKVSRNARRSCKRYYKSEAKTENINPASSETVWCYGKGCVQLIDRQNKANKEKEDKISIPSAPSASTIQARMENNAVVKRFELSILADSLQSVNLQERFKSRYKEAESVPRRFFVAAPFCHHQYLLFEPRGDGDTDHSASCGVLVTLICDDRPNASKLDPDTIFNSCNKLAELENLNRELSINEVVDIFDNNCTCCRESKGRCDSKMESAKIRKTVVAFDVLNTFTGHKTKICSIIEATKDISSAKSQNLEETASKAYDHNSPNCTKDSMICEVCYTESNEELTALIACNHWFCNDCWKMYLVVQLQQGRTAVSCPAMDCAKGVDDATFMSLAPKSYFKYKSIQQDRALDLSLKWKWCPGDKCQLVTKVLDTKICETTESAPLPCVCTCSQIWCFSCQEEPHWPVSCNQAQSFRHRTKKYQELISSGDDRVTSVSVRHCPNCNYPMEKDGGCPHMICAKCDGQFCWTCLIVWDVHSCGSDAQSEEVELTDTIGNARFNKHVRTSTYHKQARKVEYLFKAYKAVEDLMNAVDSYCKLSQHCMSIPKLPSRTQGFLALCHKNSIPEKLKLMVDTKFVSHSVLEGASMHMATSKTKKGHRKLQKLTNNLYFVIIRLDHYLTLKLEDLCSTLDQATALVDSAKGLIVSIGQVIGK